MDKNKKTPIRQQSNIGGLPNRTSTHFLARASHIVTESEKDIEARLRKAVEERGGMAIKLLSQLHRGLPDRMVLMPGGHAWFVETKSTGKRPTKLQAAVHKILRELGFEVWVIDSTFGLDSLLALLDDEQAFDKAKERL